MASTSRSVERSLQLVRLLATAGRRGLALTDLARMTDLSHSTVHRLLQQLVSERLASQMDQSRRYALGPLAYELGIAAAPRFDIWQPARALLRAFAEEVGDTVYLVVRSGREAVCLERIEGPSPVRVLTLDTGSRRPLGLGAGGLAILAALPEDERQLVIDSIASNKPYDRMVRERIAAQGLSAPGRSLFHIEELLMPEMVMPVWRGDLSARRGAQPRRPQRDGQSLDSDTVRTRRSEHADRGYHAFRRSRACAGLIR